MDHPSSTLVRHIVSIASLAVLSSPLFAASPVEASQTGNGLADIIAPLEIVVDRDPSRTMAAKRLARLHVETGNREAAWRVLERSIPHAGKDAEYLGFAATLLRRLKRAPEAIDLYRRAIALQPQEGRWWVGLGLALEDAGRRQESKLAFATARECAQTLPPELLRVAERRSH